MIEQLLGIEGGWALPGLGALALAALAVALVVVIGRGYRRWGGRP